MLEKYQIITFYEFRKLENLSDLKRSVKTEMLKNSIRGTVILANEGFNSTVCGFPPDVEKFVKAFETLFKIKLKYKSSFHSECSFQRMKVKIKREIVTFKREIDIEKGIGTHAKSQEWNEIISDPETIVLDARNRYEYEIGTFRGAINPQIDSFSQLPEFVEKNFNPSEHKKIAMFCTGGVRCEKFAAFLMAKGFKEVYQLDGGILRYLDEIPDGESLWEGECFVFDERIALDEKLRKGNAEDFSVEKNFSQTADSTSV